jgi:hypothetical protein
MMRTRLLAQRALFDIFAIAIEAINAQFQSAA